jgi:hypothetical protein
LYIKLYGVRFCFAALPLSCRSAITNLLVYQIESKMGLSKIQILEGDGLRCAIETALAELRSPTTNA